MLTPSEALQVTIFYRRSADLGYNIDVKDEHDYETRSDCILGILFGH